MVNSLNKPKNSRQLLIGIFLVILGLMFSFYVSSINTSDAAIWLVACALGFTLQKSRFCFASSFRDLFLFGSGQNMKGILIALAVSSIGFIGILSWILPNPLPGEFPSSAHVLPVGLSTIVAGVVFGVGMVVSGGCISGTIYRIEQRNHKIGFLIHVESFHEVEAHFVTVFLVTSETITDCYF